MISQASFWNNFGKFFKAIGNILPPFHQNRSCSSGDLFDGKIFALIAKNSTRPSSCANLVKWSKFFFLLRNVEKPICFYLQYVDVPKRQMANICVLLQVGKVDQVLVLHLALIEKQGFQNVK